MKSEFLSNLYAEIVENSDIIWQLTKPLIYRSELLNRIIVVPKGFQTDLATVPRVPIIYSLWGHRAHREAVVHDYLCRTGIPFEITVWKANSVFLEAMGSTGKPAYIKYPMYAGVAVGCWALFQKRSVNDTLS